MSTLCDVCGKWGHFLIVPPARATAGRFCQDCLPAEFSMPPSSKIGASAPVGFVTAEVLAYRRHEDLTAAERAEIGIPEPPVVKAANPRPSEPVQGLLF